MVKLLVADDEEKITGLLQSFFSDRGFHVITANDGKAAVVVGVTDDLTDRLDAVSLVRAGAAALGGKGGGGRPDMAQAGGPDAGAADKALAAIENALAGTAKAAE